MAFTKCKFVRPNMPKYIQPRFAIKGVSVGAAFGVASSWELRCPFLPAINVNAKVATG